MIGIVKDELVKEKRKILEKLNCNEIYFSMEKMCYLISVDSVNIVEELSSNQEEADKTSSAHKSYTRAFSRIAGCSEVTFWRY